MGTLLDTPVAAHVFDKLDPAEPGRQLRVLARLLACRSAVPGQQSVYTLSLAAAARDLLELTRMTRPTYSDALAALRANPDAYQELRAFPLAQHYDHKIVHVRMIEQLDPVSASNPELPLALLDLANEIAIDIDEACQAGCGLLAFYPGVDTGIEPVPDSHVRLVCAALERELRRETRRRHEALPALTALPFALQRALAERRRLRFTQFGITHADWEKNTWSLWNIPEDPDWRPRVPRVPFG